MTVPGHRRSAVESFGCPFRYNAIHNLGVDDVGEESIRGRAFHAAALVYILRLAALKLPADHEEATLALPEGLAVTGCPDPIIHQVQRLFFRWAEKFELDVDAFLAAEEIEQGESDRQFRPDLVYCRPGELELVDWKTFYKGLTEAQADKELQLRWYLVEAMKRWPGFPHYRFTYEFVRLGYQVTRVFTPDQIAAFEPGIQAAIDAVKKADETGEYPALPGSHCSLCRLACPVVDNPARLPIRILTKDQRDDVAGRILAMEQQLRQMKKILKAYCETEGGFELRGQVFAFFPNVKRRYPAATVLQFLDDRKLDTSKITLSATSLGDHANPRRSSAVVLAELERLKIEQAGWTFRHRRHGDDAPEGLVDLLADEEIEGDDDDGRSE